MLRTIAVADRLLFARSSRYIGVVDIAFRSREKKRPAFEEGAADEELKLE